jgi:hypothetical protein
LHRSELSNQRNLRTYATFLSGAERFCLMTEATWFFLGVAGLALWSAVVAVSEIKTARASGPGSELGSNLVLVNWRVTCSCVAKLRAFVLVVRQLAERLRQFRGAIFRRPGIKVLLLGRRPEPAPARIAEPLDADAAGQATFYRWISSAGSDYG